MTTYGYARVSTDGQSLASQDAQLHAAGCAKVYAEKISGLILVWPGPLPQNGGLRLGIETTGALNRAGVSVEEDNARKTAGGGWADMMRPVGADVGRNVKS